MLKHLITCMTLFGAVHVRSKKSCAHWKNENKCEKKGCNWNANDECKEKGCADVLREADYVCSSWTGLAADESACQAETNESDCNNLAAGQICQWEYDFDPSILGLPSECRITGDIEGEFSTDGNPGGKTAGVDCVLYGLPDENSDVDCYESNNLSILGDLDPRCSPLNFCGYAVTAYRNVLGLAGAGACGSKEKIKKDLQQAFQEGFEGLQKSSGGLPSVERRRRSSLLAGKNRKGKGKGKGKRHGKRHGKKLRGNKKGKIN